VAIRLRQRRLLCRDVDAHREAEPELIAQDLQRFLIRGDDLRGRLDLRAQEASWIAAPTTLEASVM
jgi:hypothetical protein